MIAIIPAAGCGRRMRELTETLPKPMLPLWGKPIIGHILDQLSRSPIRRVVLVVGYLADEIYSYIGCGEKFNLEVKYVSQKKLLGTAHAVDLAKKFVNPNQRLLVQFADIIVPSFWYKILSLAADSKIDGALTLERSDYSQGAAVILGEDKRVLRVVEKAPVGSVATIWNNAGIAILSSSVFECLPKKYSPKKEVSMPQVIDKWVISGASIKGSEIPPSWYIDVKNYETYQKLAAKNPPSFICNH